MVLEGHTKRPRALIVFEDQATGRLRLAGGSEDGSVRVWDLAAGSRRCSCSRTHEQVGAVADPATGETARERGLTSRARCGTRGKHAALRVVVLMMRLMGAGRPGSGRRNRLRGGGGSGVGSS